MNANQTAGVPAEVESVRRGFEQWRKERRMPSPIPDPLWTRPSTWFGSAGAFGFPQCFEWDIARSSIAKNVKPLRRWSPELYLLRRAISPPAVQELSRIG
jgi:hypothetical protein